MEVDQKKTGGDMKVECKLRSGGDMPTPLIKVSLIAKSVTKNANESSSHPSYE